MNLPLVVFGVLCFLDVFRSSYAWDNDDLEVFDVVEEVNQNFYDVLGVTQVLSCRYVQTYNRDVHVIARGCAQNGNSD